MSGERKTTNERLEELQTADSYDSISVTGQSADWIEVLAVFAVKVAGSNDVDAADVATMDADRIARLKAVFWDMTAITTEVETINHPGSGDDDGWTERNLYITITAKTAEEMKTVYHFNRNQIAALEELLEQRDLLRELIEDVYSVSGDTAALIRDLPEDLSPEREAVVRTACSLVGKVNYFWGGKSLIIGWDARWGELRLVTAAGSSTTGTGDTHRLLFPGRFIVAGRQACPTAKPFGRAELTNIRADFRNDGDCRVTVNTRNGAKKVNFPFMFFHHFTDTGIYLGNHFLVGNSNTVR